MAKKRKEKPKENVVRPAPGGVREIFPGEELYDDSPTRPFKKIVFGETDEEKHKKRRESDS